MRAELRQTRTALARLIGQLRIPDDDGVPRSEESKRKSRAAHARWDKTAAARAERRSA